MFLQEHKLKGEDTTRLEKWCSDRGYDAVVDTAYIKEVSEGGGTAAVGRGVGIRRLTAHDDAGFQGRLTMVVAELQRDVLGGSLYGVSGQPAAAQIPLWRHLAARRICAGLPFVVSGDWQVEPDVLKASGLPSLLDATVVHPGCPTNTHTGSEIDYFLVSNELLTDGYTVDVLVDACFTHTCHYCSKLVRAKARPVNEGSVNRG